MTTGCGVGLTGRYPTAILLSVVMVCASLNEAQAQAHLISATQPFSIRFQQSKKVTTGTLNGQFNRKRGATGDVPHGQIKLFHPNGKLALKGQYRNGKPDGLWTRWYSDGAIFGTYRYVNGELDGEVIQYWKNGKVARASYYRAGKPSGQSIVYSAQQKVIARAFYAYKGDKSTSLRFRYLCNYRGTGKLAKCKSISRIEEDLATFLSRDEVTDLLEAIDGLYENLGLDQGADVLAACGGNRVAAFSLSSAATLQQTSGRGGRGDLGNLLDSLSGDVSASVDTEALSNRAGAVCGGASGGGGSGSGSGDSSPRDSQNVDQAVGAMQNLVDSCQESQAAKWFGSATVGNSSMMGAAAVDPRALIIAGGAAIAAVLLEKAVETLFDLVTDDGYSREGVTQGEGRTKYTHKENSEDFKIVDELRETTEYHSQNELGGVTVVTEYDHPVRQGLVFVYNETTKKDKDGKVVEIRRVTRELGKPGKKTQVTTYNDDGTSATYEYDEDGKPTGGGGVAMPEGAGPSRCEQIKAAWESFKRRCDRAHWHTYECDQFVRTLNNCVDTAEIRPSPDGDATCNRRSQKERDLAERAACERKKGVMIVMPGGRNMCDKPTVSRAALDLNICTDPQAMCRPDTALEEVVMPREMTRERPPN